jgi:hypothetical protein
MRSVLTGANATVLSTGEKKSLQQDREIISKNWPLAIILCVTFMNPSYKKYLLISQS